jgi:DNA-binding MarR family transcriptional regulator
MKGISEIDYRSLAAFRYHIRKYLAHSENAARSAGLEPRQYELLLALRALSDGERPTIGALAEQLHLRHHSTVELVNRAEQKDLVRRKRMAENRSYVLVEITSKGARALDKVLGDRLKELRAAGPTLAKILADLSGTRKAPPK